MTDTFLPTACLTDLSNRGWIDRGMTTEPGAPGKTITRHHFEDPQRCLHLRLSDISVDGKCIGFALVDVSYYYLASRCSYPVAPVVHLSHAEARSEASSVRNSLLFLNAHGIALQSVVLRRKTAGGGIKKDRHYIGGPV